MLATPGVLVPLRWGNPGSITKFHSFLCSFQETIDPLGLVPVCEIMDPPLNPLDPSLTAVNS